MCELELDVPNDIYMSEDIEDKDPVFGDEVEDYGFGFDSNGEPIDESTVDELCRITEEIVDDQLKNLIVYPFVQRDNFDYYMSGGAWGGTFSFDIDGDVTDKNINIYDFQLNHNESIIGFNGSAVTNPGRFSLSVRINVTNNSVSTDIWDVSVYDSDNRYSSWDTEQFFKCFDKEAIESYISEQVEPVRNEVAHTIFNI